MSERHHDHHDHDHHDHDHFSDVELSVKALEYLLVEKGLVDPAALEIARDERASSTDAAAAARGCIRLIREAADALGFPHRDIFSRAGHDAHYISRIAPTAMIFTPYRDGISHNEAEHAERDETATGVNVLLHAVLSRANR